jgi:Metal binding domain of Ada
VPEGSGVTKAAAGMLFGKRGLKKVHRAGCVFGERIKAEDRVYFKSMQEAAAAGYEACKICRPGQ